MNAGQQHWTLVTDSCVFTQIADAGCQVWLRNGSDWPQMGQNKSFTFSDQISEIWSEEESVLSHLGLIWPTLESNLTSFKLLSDKICMLKLRGFQMFGRARVYGVLIPGQFFKLWNCRHTSAPRYLYMSPVYLFPSFISLSPLPSSVYPPSPPSLVNTKNRILSDWSDVAALWQAAMINQWVNSDATQGGRLGLKLGQIGTKGNKSGNF